MNTQMPMPTPDDISPAVRKLMRRRWLVAEIDALVATGKLDEDEHFELIDGEIIPLPAKGNHHEPLKGALNLYWALRLPQNVRFIPETTFRLSPETFVEPDFLFFRTADRLVGLRGRDALLAVEVADTSLYYDRGRKSRLYASFGIPEVWIINAGKLETHIHRRLGSEDYEEKITLPATETLVPSFAPELAVCLAELQVL